MGWPALRDMMNKATVSTLTNAEITYVDSAGAQHPITDGIFDDRYLQEPATDAGVTTTGPWVGVNLPDLPEDPEDNQDSCRFIIDGVTFRVMDVQRDGEKHAKIRLKKV